MWDAMDSWNDLLVTNCKHQNPDSYWSEKDSSYSCQVNMAGIEKENINVSIDGRLLKVTAEQDGHKYSSTAYIPKKSDPNDASVEYKNGMLYLTLKKQERHKSIELEIS